MSMSDGFRQLILHPQQADFIVKSDDLVVVLSELGFIGEPVSESMLPDSATNSDHVRRFYVGPQFLQHISFMGCAPAIEFQPPVNQSSTGDSVNWQSFTFVNLSVTTRQPAWYADLQLAKPACPSCGKRITQPQEVLNQKNKSMRCPHCNKQASLCDFNWREFGGCASTLVSIVNVYPKEAIPSSNLLNQLANLTQVSWRYFYFYGQLV